MHETTAVPITAPDGARAAPAAAWPRSSVGWYAVFVLTIAYVLAFVDRTILSLLVGPIRADLGLSDTQLSLVQGFAFAVFYTTLGLPIALLADRLNRRNIIALGVALWSAATALCALPRSFAGLFAARVGVGVGEAALSPAAYSMIADLFPPNRLSRALATYTIGVFAGSGLAYLIGGAVVGAVTKIGSVEVPLLGELRPWQLVFLLVSLPGLPIALWILTLPEPVRRRCTDAPGGAAAHLSTAASHLYGHMRAHWQVYLSHMLGFSLIALLFNASIAWLPTYLMRVFGLSSAQTGFWLGSILLVVGVSAVMLGGWLSDRLQTAGYSDATMRVGLISAVGALPFAAAATTVDSLPLSLTLIAALLFFVTLPYGAAAAALQLVTPSHMRATASSVYLCLLNLIGLGLGPTLVALLTDHYFHSDLAVGRSLAVACTLAAPLAAGVLWWGLPHFRRAADALRTTQARHEVD